MTAYTSVTGGTILPAYPQFLSYTLTGQLSLFWPTDFTNSTNVVAAIMHVSAASPQNVVMPDAKKTSPGANALIANIGTANVTIQTNTGTPIVTIAPGASYFVYLSDTSTQAGTWFTNLNGGGGTAVTSITLASGTNNVTYNGSSSATITSAGTITLALANDLLALSSFGSSTGISTRTAANTWTLRTLTGTANQISITNGNGVSGNPTFSLPTTITGINNLTVGNLNLTGNTISSLNTNGNILLSPNGLLGSVIVNKGLALFSGGSVTATIEFFNLANDGYVAFKGGNCTSGSTIQWVLPTVDGTAGQVMAHTGFGGVLAWTNVPTVTGATTVNAIARYSNITGGLTNSTASVDNNGIITSKGLNLINVGFDVPLVFRGSNNVNSVTISTSGLFQDYTYNFPASAPTLPNCTIVYDGNYEFEQVVVTKTIPVTFSEARAMSANPVQIIAGVPNTIINIHKWTVSLVYGGVVYAGGGNLYLEYGSTPLAAGVTAAGPIASAGFMDNAASTLSTVNGAALTAVPRASFIGLGIYMSNITAPFTAGTSNLEVVVEYTISYV